ncbi:MAG: hypothetical protein WC558_14145 [Patulibacter sp.]
MTANRMATYDAAVASDHLNRARNATRGAEHRARSALQRLPDPLGRQVLDAFVTGVCRTEPG